MFGFQCIWVGDGAFGFDNLAYMGCGGGRSNLLYVYGIFTEDTKDKACVRRWQHVEVSIVVVHLVYDAKCAERYHQA